MLMRHQNSDGNGATEAKDAVGRATQYQLTMTASRGPSRNSDPYALRYRWVNFHDAPQPLEVPIRGESVQPESHRTAELNMEAPSMLWAH